MRNKDLDSNVPLTITITPGGSRPSHAIPISGRSYAVLRILIPALAVLELSLIGSWIWLFQRSSMVQALEEEVATLSVSAAAATTLSARLQALEQEYGRLRAVYTHVEGEENLDPWLTIGSASMQTPGDDSVVTRNYEARPTEWPLAAAGFVTRVAGAGEVRHPGIDIAVASGTYVRASGTGVVDRVGSDEVYGNFVLLDHGGGLETRYAHLSVTFVAEGSQVLAGEAIALAGTTGLSTAPHLHFEVRQDGENLNPLEFVTQPR